METRKWPCSKKILLFVIDNTLRTLYETIYKHFLKQLDLYSIENSLDPDRLASDKPADQDP